MIFVFFSLNLLLIDIQTYFPYTKKKPKLLSNNTNSNRWNRSKQHTQTENWKVKRITNTFCWKFVEFSTFNTRYKLQFLLFSSSRNHKFLKRTQIVQRSVFLLFLSIFIWTLLNCFSFPVWRNIISSTFSNVEYTGQLSSHTDTYKHIHARDFNLITFCLPLFYVVRSIKIECKLSNGIGAKEMMHISLRMSVKERGAAYWIDRNMYAWWQHWTHSVWPYDIDHWHFVGNSSLACM